MRLFCFSLFLILLFNCNPNKTKRSKPIDFIPGNASFVLKTSNLESLKSSINNSHLLQQISSTTAYENLANTLNIVPHLKPSGDLLICFSSDDKDSLQYTLITKVNKTLFETDSLQDYIQETLSYRNKTIIKSTLKDKTFYSTVMDSIFFLSSSEAQVHQIFDRKAKNVELEKVYNIVSNDKTFSMVLKPDSSFLKSLFVEDSISLKTFTNYIATDVSIDPGEVLLNGITKATDSSKSLINIFKNTTSQENQTHHITPSNSDGFMSFTFDDYSQFKTNLSRFHQRDSISETTLFDNIVEVGVIYEDKHHAIALNSIDVIDTKDALLSEQTRIGTYRGIEIFSFSQPELFSDTFAPLISYNKAAKYCILENFFIFTGSTDMLQNIIANYQNKTTLNEKIYFQNAQEHLSDASSLMQVVNADALKAIFDKNLEDNSNYTLDNYKISALQFIYENNFAHINAILQRSKSQASLNSVSEELNIKLDTDVLTNPQFVKNHITGQKEIVVQDINNNLYLISNKGKILWKKQIHGPVLGAIEQIDIYKNGRLQLAFATARRVYVIDRNGNNVGPFPLKFNDNITQPLSVFDYENTKNYRLMVTQGNQVVMYNTKAQIVSGFTFKTANDAIICQPKHFRIGTKDYISFKTQNKFYILNRTGKSRVTPKTSNTYSKQPVFVYKNNFTTTTTDGNLVTIDTKGNVSTKTLNLSKNHHVTTTNKTLVTFNENKLSIKGKTVEMDYGDYKSPDIFYINDKIYIAITDVQAHKIHLFDSQAKLLSNFPVYGNSSMALDNIDKDKNLEFVSKGENNSIILYQIN